MTPGGHIESLKKKLDFLLDRHPVGAAGWMIVSDLKGDLDKLEQYYNQAALAGGDDAVEDISR